jgi:antitoxin FitA
MQDTCDNGDMAKTIQIRNVPDEVHRKLRVRAAEAGLSLSEYCLRELRQSASRTAIAEILQRGPLPGGGVTREDILRAIDEGRRSR